MRIPAIDTIFQSQVRTRRITVYKSHTSHHFIGWYESCFNKWTHDRSKKYYTKHFLSLILVLILHVVFIFKIKICQDTRRMIVLTLLKNSGKISTFFPSLLLPVFSLWSVWKNVVCCCIRNTKIQNRFNQTNKVFI